MAAVFIGVCVVLLLRGIVGLARHGAGVRITGPLDREVDYDNPTSRGTYFWTNLRPR